MARSRRIVFLTGVIYNVYSFNKHTTNFKLGVCVVRTIDTRNSFLSHFRVFFVKINIPIKFAGIINVLRQRRIIQIIIL